MASKWGMASAWTLFSSLYCQENKDRVPFRAGFFFMEMKQLSILKHPCLSPQSPALQYSVKCTYGQGETSFVILK